jgi:SPP1 family predicted phage head-tail adaptor
MRAGDLKHRITLEIPTRVKNDLGEWVETWGLFATVWSAIEPLSGNLFYQAQQANSEAQGRIRIRYIENLNPPVRVKYGDIIYEVLSIIQPRTAKKELHLIYKERLD